MTGKHLFITLRNLKKNLLYAILVIVGLSIGITTFLSTIQWSVWHLNFDKEFTDYRQIYRLTFEEIDDNFYRHTARILHGSALNKIVFTEMISGVDVSGRLAPYRKAAFRIGDDSYYDSHAYACDPGFVTIFQPEVISGQRSNLLAEPQTAILTESTALRFFGSRDPVGSTFEMVPQVEVGPEIFTVVAVIRDLPRNSHFKISLLTSFDNPMEYRGTAWAYLKLNPSSRPDEVESGIRTFVEENVDLSPEDHINPRLQPLREIHLRSHKAREIQPNIRYRTVMILMVSGMMVFLLAWFNFTLLAFSQNQVRIQRLVTRWQMGAGRSDFFRQFFFHNLIISTISLLAGILLTLLLQPAIRRLGGNYMFQDRDFFLSSVALLMVLILLGSVITSLLSTSRLFRYLRLRHLNSRLGAPPDSTGRNIFIRGVIILEFVITFVLVANLSMIARQTRFAMDQQLGANHPGAIHLTNLHRAIIDQYPAFKEKMLESPAVVAVTASLEEPTGETMDANTFEISGIDEGNKQLFLFPVDEDFFRFYRLNMIAGRDLPENYNSNDSAEFYVLNETAARMITDHPDELIGSELTLHFGYPGLIWPGPITGIVEDFHLSGLDYEIQPMVIFPKYVWLYCFSILPSGRPGPVLEHLKKVWEELFPEFPLEYELTSSLVEEMYGDELVQINILMAFSLLSIVIAGLGLFAFSGFFMNRKVKSVALKKIHGAAMGQLIMPELLYYFWLALLSSAIAVPVSFFLIEQWLRNFKYRLAIPFWIFPVSALILIIFSWIAVLYHSLRLARINPVEFIREQ